MNKCSIIESFSVYEVSIIHVIQTQDCTTTRLYREKKYGGLNGFFTIWLGSGVFTLDAGGAAPPPPHHWGEFVMATHGRQKIGAPRPMWPIVKNKILNTNVWICYRRSTMGEERLNALFLLVYSPRYYTDRDLLLTIGLLYRKSRVCISRSQRCRTM